MGLGIFHCCHGRFSHGNLKIPSEVNLSSRDCGLDLANNIEKDANEFGIKGRMKLALLTAIPPAPASKEHDFPVNIQKFEHALAQIRKTGVS